MRDSLGKWGFFAYEIICLIVITIVMVNVVQGLLDYKRSKYIYIVPDWIICVAPAVVAAKCLCLAVGSPITWSLLLAYIIINLTALWE